MATSDVFLRKEEVEKVTYAIIGNGISFTFASKCYEPRDAENRALARAKGLHCHLYCRKSDGSIYEVYPYRRRVERQSKIAHRMHSEMLGNEPLIQGVQVQVG